MLKKQRAEILLQSRHYEEASYMFKQVYALADSLNIKSVQNQLNEFNTLFKVDELEKEQQREHTRYVYIVLGIIIAALLLMGILGLYFMNRLRQKNHELAVALDHAHESDRMKTAFIQHVSHEIRTPLNVITGFAQVMGNPNYQLSEEDRENIVNSVETNTREITNFINELLEFSEHESQNHYEKCDVIHVNGFCQEIIDRAQQVNNGHLELTYESMVEDAMTITSNAEALRRILSQLVSNGMKFTEQGSVKLKTQLSEDRSMLKITVADTGIGIPNDQRERVFEKFYKIDSFKRGLGLGLPMARRIAHVLGGDLQLDDTYTDGTRFILLLPNQTSPV